MLSVCAIDVSEGGHGAVGRLSGFQMEEELGGSVVRDPTHTCRERICTLRTQHILGMTPEPSGSSSERWCMERQKHSSHL